jgi:type VI secretion system protein ImpL
MDTPFRLTDRLSLAFFWPPIFLAWVLALYRIDGTLQPLVWVVLTSVLVLMVVSIIWLAADRVSAEDAPGLPWYLVIGPPASGKATLVRQAGFVERRAAGLRRQTDPYFAARSIVLEQVGTFVLYREEDVDRPTQQALIAQAKRFLRGKPLKGVLVTIGADTQGGVATARILRGRIRDLLEPLGLDVPIYLVVTKCDQLPGFAAFFGGLSSAERAQGWGATLAADRRADAGAGFAQESLVLHQALDERRLAWLERGDPRANGDTYRFPTVFSETCGHLQAFVDELFGGARGDEPLLFRGAYFTGVAAEPTIEERRGYFIAELLTKVLRHDQDLARPSERAMRRLWQWRMVLTAGAFLISLAILVPI